MSITTAPAPRDHELASGIWDENTASVQYRVVKRTGDKITYADSSSDLPCGVLELSKAVKGENVPYIPIQGKLVNFTVSGATAVGFVEADTDGKVKAYSAGAGKYACGYIYKAGSADGDVVIGVWLGPVQYS